ncbi:MAG: D-alanyl-D-alanine carboxypeptidase family protein [Clostridiaceae bacterium]
MKKKRLTAILALMMVFLMNLNVIAAGENTAKPDIYGQAAITIDLQTNEIIYEKNIDLNMYPASTTKLLTALLLAENKNKTDLLTYTESAKSQPEYSLNVNLQPIQVGEKMSAKDAMLGLMLYSGNDVAYMIADNISGNATAFMDKMNEKIKALKLKNTHFVTPNGLHDTNHYTTAFDLSVIGREALKNEWVKETVGTKAATITVSSGVSMAIENRNKLLGKNGCIGGKTGYTSQAGKCLVALYERDGRQMLGVVMNSVYDKDDVFVFNDMEKIIDWSYNAKRTTLFSKGNVIKIQNFEYKPLIFAGPVKTIDVPLISKEDITYYENDVNKAELKENYKFNKISLPALIGAKSIGTLSLEERTTINTYNVYSDLSAFSIIKANLLLYAGLLAGLVILIAVIVILIKTLRGRNKKGRTYYY